MFQEYLKQEIAVVPSPLRGEGQGGGDNCLGYFIPLPPSPQPPPLKGGGDLVPRTYWRQELIKDTRALKKSYFVILSEAKELVFMRFFGRFAPSE
jgi:hypothetical protein